MTEEGTTRQRRKGAKPDWLKVRLPGGAKYGKLKDLLHRGDLHTVCEEALCPNMGRCWEHGRATLMILGDKCSRCCSFCAVLSQRPETPDTEEPGRVARAVKQMELREIVVTSVTRDDLEDGGAGIWADTILAIRTQCPGILIEVLIPDFGGRSDLLERVAAAGPDVVAHNLETVPRLYSQIRPQADYARSLKVLRFFAEAGFITKTGIMVGLGEAEDEIFGLMRDAVHAGSRIFTVGQYLQPSKDHYPVHRYVSPDEFDEYRRKGLEEGFDIVLSAPLVRSSFHSEEQTAYVRFRLESAQRRT